MQEQEQEQKQGLNWTTRGVGRSGGRRTAEPRCPCPVSAPSRSCTGPPRAAQPTHLTHARTHRHTRNLEAKLENKSCCSISSFLLTFCAQVGSQLCKTSCTHVPKWVVKNLQRRKKQSGVSCARPVARASPKG